MLSYTLHKCLYGYKPLYCLDDKIILGKRNQLYFAPLNLEYVESICRLPGGMLLNRFRLFDRISRGGLQVVSLLDGDAALVVNKSKIWKVNLKDHSFAMDFEIPDGKKLLNVSKFVDVQGHEDSICFGEYFQNPYMDSVRIWSRPINPNGQWRVAHTFKKGLINHIHNIIPDQRIGAAWILTGDFHQGASLWLAKNDFNEVKRVKQGDQSYRAVWMEHVANNEYCYATDSQLQVNSLKRLIHSRESCQIEEIVEIEGSSIYYGKNRDVIVFSTTVEPGAPTGNSIRDIFETTPGPGIKSKYACIYTMDSSSNVHEIYRARKDLFPMRLAQFGTFTFPGGVMPQRSIYAYGVAVDKYDDACMLFKAQ